MSRRTTVPAAQSTSTAVLLAVLLAVLAGGCSRSDTHHEPGTGHEVATGSVPPATHVPETGEGSDRGAVIEVTVSGGEVSPPPGRVDVTRGERVTLTVTSDTADELHVHGYDESARLPADEPVTLSFTADRTGVFEVETHGSGLVLTQLQVR